MMDEHGREPEATGDIVEIPQGLADLIGPIFFEAWK